MSLLPKDKFNMNPCWKNIFKSFSETT